ncbi:MAG: hypothetical protein RTU92_00610 [Candidatus Thorarchaeota archaeon]
MKRFLALVVCLVFVLPSVTIAVTVFNNEEHNINPLDRHDELIGAGASVSFIIFVDAGQTLIGEFEVRSGGAINFYIIDEDNFMKMIDGESFSSLYRRIGVSSDTWSVVIPSDKLWMVVYENPNAGQVHVVGTADIDNSGFIWGVLVPGIAIIGIAILAVFSICCLTSLERTEKPDLENGEPQIHFVRSMPYEVLWNILVEFVGNQGYTLNDYDNDLKVMNTGNISCLIGVVSQRLDVMRSHISRVLQLDSSITHGIIVVRDRGIKEFEVLNGKVLFIIGSDNYIAHIEYWLNELIDKSELEHEA